MSPFHTSFILDKTLLFLSTANPAVIIIVIIHPIIFYF